MPSGKEWLYNRCMDGQTLSGSRKREPDYPQATSSFLESRSRRTLLRTNFATNGTRIQMREAPELDAEQHLIPSACRQRWGKNTSIRKATDNALTSKPRLNFAFQTICEIQTWNIEIWEVDLCYILSIRSQRLSITIETEKYSTYLLFPTSRSLVFYPKNQQIFVRTDTQPRPN